MANPQPKHFTKFSNELLEAIIQYPCSGLKKDIILFLIRMSYGYHSKTAALSLKTITDKLKRTKAKISVALAELVKDNVIHVVQSSTAAHQSRVLKLNKDYETWIVDGSPLGKRLSAWETVTGIDNCTISQMENDAISRMGNPDRVQPIEKTDSYRELKKDIKKDKDIYRFSDIVFPEELIQIPGFKDAFQDWYTYRNEVKKALTPTAVKRQLNQLKDFQQKGHNVIDIIDTAITRRWQGLFEPRQPAPTSNTPSTNHNQQYIPSSEKVYI